MAAKKFKIAKVYVMPEAAFLTDPDATGAGYKHLKVLPDASWMPTADIIERPGLTNDLVSQQHVVGAKGGTLAFKMELKASGTPAASTIAAIAAEADQILKNGLGTVVRGTGAVTTAGSTTSTLKVASTAAFAKYMMVLVSGQIRFITSIPNGTDLVLDRALSGAPGAGVTIYASSLYKRANTGHVSLAFVVIRDGIEYTLLGCKVKVKLAGITARGTALLDVQVDVGTWTETTKASLPSSDLTGITAVKAPVIKGAEFAVAGVTEPVSSLEFDPGMTFEFQESTEGADNKSGFEAVDAQPQGVFNPYYAASRLADMLAGGTKSLAFACGDQTNGFGIYIPVAQYGQVGLEDRNGMVGQSVPFMVRDNGTDPEFVICTF